MNTGLFREEALRAESRLFSGERVLYQPPTLRFLFLFFCAVFLVLLIFAATAGVSRSETVRGHLNSTAGTAKVYAPRSGVATSVLVAEGVTVERGEVLLTIDTPTFESGGQSVHLYYLKLLAEQEATLLTRQEVLALRESEGLRGVQERISSLTRELAMREDQRALIEQRVVLGEQAFLRSAAMLSKGVIPLAGHAQAQEAVYAARQLLISHDVEAQGRASVITQLLQEKTQLALEFQNERLEMDSGASQLAIRRKELEVQQTFSITAPVSGIVSALLVEAGAHVETGRPVLTLLPSPVALEALIYVPSRALGEIAEQQQIMLAYDAYPVAVYGTFPALVSAISMATVDPRETLIPLDLQEPAYRVQAILVEPDSNLPTRVRLLPGMQFSAQIVTGRQTLLARVTSPLRTLERRL